MEVQLLKDVFLLKINVSIKFNNYRHVRRWKRKDEGLTDVLGYLRVMCEQDFFYTAHF